MKRKYDIDDKVIVKVDIPFKQAEAERYRRFIATRKAGQVVRSLLVRAMDEADGIASSCGEARELAAFIASLSSEQLNQLKFAKADVQDTGAASA